MNRKVLFHVVLAAVVVGILSAAFALGESKPSVQKAVMAVYPGCALEKRVEGFIRIRVKIDQRGNVIESVPLGGNDQPLIFPETKTNAQFGHECLCQAAAKAASNWKFSGVTGNTDLVLGFNFMLVSAIPIGEDLGAVYLPPYNAEIRALLPLVEARTGDPR